jgi:hypothetical protein
MGKWLTSYLLGKLAEIRRLDQDIRECTACRDDPEIEKLAMMGGFKFHWEPYS